jgi:5-methylcytosine-specific restriction endonuclease McrA
MKKNKSEATYKWQREKEKDEFFGRYKLRIIEDFYKNKFFALFDYQCFKCGKKEKHIKEIGNPPVLCIDHHIPMILGGHLVPGNLVSLCRSCNNKKKDKAPEEFYSSEELKKLAPLLKKQKNIFDFTFNWHLWSEDREGYLLSLGIDPIIVNKAIYDENFSGYVGLPYDNFLVSLSVNKIDDKKQSSKF